MVEPPTRIVPSVSGSDVGDVSVAPGNVMDDICTFSAGAVPVFAMRKADRSDVIFTKLAPGATADRTTGDARHSTSTVTKAPGLEATRTINRFAEASVTGLTILPTR